MAQVRKNSSSHSAQITVSESGNLAQGEGSHIASSQSIKRSVRKISTEGLIVLPSEPGLVTFESASSSRPCSSMDCTSGVRSRSAGRVERSLKLARKKELEGEIPRRNSTGAEIVVNKDSITSNLGRLKLTKQDQGIESPTKTDIDLSLDSDKDKCGPSDSSDSSDKVQEAPVELKGEFLMAVMDENYGKAKEACRQILLLEPDNKTCSEFHAVIVEKMQQDAADEDNDSSEEDSDSSGSSLSSSSSTESSEWGEEDKSEDSENSEDDDSDNGESSSDDENLTPPSSPINLIMGGLPIKPQSR